MLAIALAGEQRACMYTAAGWFLGRREARGDRFGKDNFGCIGLGVQAMLSSGGDAPRQEDLCAGARPRHPSCNLSCCVAPWMLGEQISAAIDACRAGFFDESPLALATAPSAGEECSRKRAASREAPASACPAPAAKACYLALL